MQATSDPVPTLAQLLDRVDELTPLPHVSARVIQLAEDERFSAYDLAAVISTDTALTAKILRLANSAYYGFPRRIMTVRDAVVLIGFRAVRASAIAASMIDLFTTEDDEDEQFSSDLFWGHSVACALVAETMAKETGYARPDEAFTAGILHDVGRLVLSQYAEEAFTRALVGALEEGTPLIDAERAEFGYDHAETGGKLAERWSFPSEITEAIADHHNLRSAPDRSGLTYVVAHANALCHRHGLWCGLDAEDGSRVYPRETQAMAEDPVYGAVMRRIGGREEIEEQVRDFIANASDREIVWYTRADETGPAGRPGKPEEAA